MEAVVLAAGEGRRMRPLTERWPKALLPVDRSPVISLLLRQLQVAPLGRVTIVVGHLGAQIERFVGDGAAFGLEVSYARQPAQLGSADALRCALAAGAEPPLLVTAADTVYREGDLRAAAGSFEASGAVGALGVRPVPGEELPARSAVGVEDGRIAWLLEKPIGRRRAPALAAAPLWFIGASLVPRVETVPGPPYELAQAFQAAVDAGEELLAVELGPTRDLTFPADVVRHNFPYLGRRGSEEGQ